MSRSAVTGASTPFSADGVLRDAAHWVEVFEAAFAGGSYESVVRIAPFVHPEYVATQPQLPDVHGVAELLDMFARLYALVPDLSGQVTRSEIGKAQAFLEVTLTGTLGGKPFELVMCDYFALSDGKVIARVTYGDPIPLWKVVASRPRAWLRWWRSGLGFPPRKPAARLLSHGL